MSNARKILIVDDDAELANALVEQLALHEEFDAVAVDSAILRLIVLVLLLGIPLSRANPIKVVTGLALFAISSAIYGDAGKVSWEVAAWLAGGTAIGSYFASRHAASDGAKKWVYLLLQISVTIETLLLAGQWLGWLPRTVGQ